MTDKKQPINLTECGVNLAIWMNQTEHGVRYNTELTRSYRDKEGHWQQTHSMRESDQLVAANLYARGHNMIQRLKHEHAMHNQASAKAENAFHDASAPQPSDP